jgi:hypothetical protein
MKYPHLESIVLIAIFILIMVFGSSNIFASGYHGEIHTSTEINNTKVEKTTSTAGMAMNGAMAQIHPSKNVRGLQLGLGLAKSGRHVGGAVGIHSNVKGWGLVGGSYAREGSDEVLGLGFNKSFNQ